LTRSSNRASLGEGRFVIGVDIGGTFTDVVVIDRTDGSCEELKVLTTYDDPLRAVLQSLREVESSLGKPVADAGLLVHATTLAINTVIERRGATTALLTTEGFRDVIETGREDRYDLYDLQIELTPPLVPRRRRLTLPERTDAAGRVVAGIEAADVEAVASTFREAGCEAVAVCFLNSYANPENESVVVEQLRSLLPGVFVTHSASVSQTIREYERFLATAVNAYIGPRVSEYLGRLEEALAQAGHRDRVRIMKSNGGLCSVADAVSTPVQILESGPAGGVIAAAGIAREHGCGEAVAFDMGGTTAKAALIIEGVPLFTDELEVARQARLVTGSGMPLRLESVDLVEIGAGGGSIAHINELGLLQVGPESAGSTPGPACYGRGGKRPTVTDADLLLGYLNPDFFANGTVPLSIEAARGAYRADLVEPLAVADEVEAAWAVYSLVNENMAAAIRLPCVEHGVDPAGITLIATGGAGPCHAGRLVELIGCAGAICPPRAGVASALGLLLASETFERAVTDLAVLDEITMADVGTRAQRIDDEIRASNDVPDDVRRQVILRMRVRGQGYEIPVEWRESDGTADLRARFAASYELRFGRAPTKGLVEIVTWGVKLHRPGAAERVQAPSLQAELPVGERSAYFGPELGWRPARVLQRAACRPGGVEQGPLLIEEPSCTTVIWPGQEARFGADGSIVLTAGAGRAA
jgi:N-methylhydantoinase A